MSIRKLGRSIARREALVRWCVAVSLAVLASFSYMMGAAKTVAQITVVPTLDRNRLSSGSNISISLPSRIVNSMVAPGWQRTNETLTIDAASSMPLAELSWTGKITKTDTVSLKASPNSGIVDIFVNGKRTHLDLYDPFGKTFYINLVSLAPWNSIIHLHALMGAVVIFLLVIAVSYAGLMVVLPPPIAVAKTHGKLLNTAYLARLDHLRFAAAAMVLLYHFFHDYVGAGYRSHIPPAAIVAEGHTGVALFMVLSGFIFAHIGHNKEINYKYFVLARIVRIFPLYIFALVLAISTKRWDFKPIDILLFVFPMANFYSAIAIPYFGQLWTIGVEFQFYAIFPFLNKFTNLRGPRYLFGILVLFVLIRAFYFNLYGDARDFGYWTILGRMDQFLIGMLGSIVYKSKSRYISSLLGFPGAAILMLGVLTTFNVHFGGYAGSGHSPLWIVWPTIEAGAWMLVTVTYLSWSVRIPAILDELLARFGAVSFSIYVMQYVAIPQLQLYIGVVPFSSDWNLNVVLSGIFLALPAVLLLSALTYSLIEKPFFEFKFRYVHQDKEGGQSIASWPQQHSVDTLNRAEAMR